MSLLSNLISCHPIPTPVPCTRRWSGPYRAGAPNAVWSFTRPSPRPSPATPTHRHDHFAGDSLARPTYSVRDTLGRGDQDTSDRPAGAADPALGDPAGDGDGHGDVSQLALLHVPLRGRCLRRHRGVDGAGDDRTRRHHRARRFPGTTAAARLAARTTTQALLVLVPISPGLLRGAHTERGEHRHEIVPDLPSPAGMRRGHGPVRADDARRWRWREAPRGTPRGGARGGEHPPPGRARVVFSRRAGGRERGPVSPKKTSRRRYLRNAAYGLVALAVIGAIVYGTTRTKHGAALSAQERTLLDQAASQAEAAGCAPVQTIPAYAGAPDQAHIGTQVASPPPLSSYPSTPPASGPHNPSPQGAGVYSSPPPVYSTIHSLEHGAAIVWYDPSALGQELERIKSFFNGAATSDHVIVAPYSYPDQGAAGKLPGGKQMVMVAWHHVESCDRPSLAAAFDFVAHYRFPPPAGESYKGDAPEKGASI